MGVLNNIRNLFVTRYTNGSWWIGNNSAKHNTSQYMDLYKSVYALNACINIGANYAAKFKWGVKNQDGTIDYNDPLLDLIKNPNPYQTTVDLVKQLYIFKSVHGWSYQKTFGTSLNTSALYNLNPSSIDFKDYTNKPLLVWKGKDKSDLNTLDFIYDDNGIRKTFRFSDVMPFYDIANGLGSDSCSMYTSPSKIEGILKSISNLDLKLDGENVSDQTIGREMFFASGAGQNNPDSYISGVKSLESKEREDIDNKLNNKSWLKSQRLRSFAPSQPTEHKDLSIDSKKFDFSGGMTKHETIIARAFSVPNELYQAYKEGAKMENQHGAEVKYIDYIYDTYIEDLASSWTKSFGDPSKPFVATTNHLRALKKEENKKYDNALKLSQTLANLQKAGIADEQALNVLSDFGIDLNG